MRPSGYAAASYSGGTGFESGTENRLPQLKCFVFILIRLMLNASQHGSYYIGRHAYLLLCHYRTLHFVHTRHLCYGVHLTFSYMQHLAVGLHNRHCSLRDSKSNLTYFLREIPSQKRPEYGRGASLRPLTVKIRFLF